MNAVNRIRGYVLSDVGKVRQNNEDNFLLGHCLNEQSQDRMDASFCEDLSSWSCVAVFDGMGGIDCGEVASYTAASVFQEAFLMPVNSSKNDMTIFAETVFEKANAAVCSLDTENILCGTTGTVAVTNSSGFKIFHKGDSRAYLYRDEQMYCLSKDHTLAQLKVDVGIYSSVAQAPEKEHHQLVEYLGMEDENSKPFESDWIEWGKNDRLLLCSDGLYDMCNENEMTDVLRRNITLEECTDELVKLALKNGGRDNVTILIVEVI